MYLGEAKVGRKVKVVKGYLEGQTGEIIGRLSIQYHDCPIEVRMDNDGLTATFHETQLEKVSPELCNILKVLEPEHVKIRRDEDLKDEIRDLAEAARDFADSYFASERMMGAVGLFTNGEVSKALEMEYRTLSELSDKNRAWEKALAEHRINERNKE